MRFVAGLGEANNPDEANKKPRTMNPGLKIAFRIGGSYGDRKQVAVSIQVTSPKSKAARVIAPAELPVYS